MRQYHVDDHKLVKAWKFDHEIIGLVTTYDSRYAFARLRNDSIHRICIDSETVISHCEDSLDGDVATMAPTRDNKSLITCG